MDDYYNKYSSCIGEDALKWEEPALSRHLTMSLPDSTVRELERRQHKIKRKHRTWAKTMNEALDICNTEDLIELRGAHIRPRPFRSSVHRAHR